MTKKTIIRAISKIANPLVKCTVLSTKDDFEKIFAVSYKGNGKRSAVRIKHGTTIKKLVRLCKEAQNVCLA